MKKLFILFAIALFPLGINAQRVSKIVSDGDTVTTLSDTLYFSAAQIGEDNATKAIKLKPVIDAVDPGWLNIKNFGAIPNDGITDAVALQAAIDSAYTFTGETYTSYGYLSTYTPTVYISSGEWNIDDTITLRHQVSIKVERGALIRSSVDGPLFSTNETQDDGGGLFGASIDGGNWRGPRTTSNDNYGQSNSQFIRLYSTSDEGKEGITACSFTNMIIREFDKGIFIAEESGEAGWVNDVRFQNILMDRMRCYVQDSTGGANVYANVTIQPSSGMDEDTLINVGGSNNTYSNLMFWDYDDSDSIIGIYVTGNFNRFDTYGAMQESYTEDYGQGNRFELPFGSIGSSTTLRELTNSSTPSLLRFNKKKASGAPDVVNGTSLGKISFQGFHTDDYYEAATITTNVGAAPGADDMPGSLGFYVSPDGSATPELYFRAYGGNVRFTKKILPESDGGTAIGQWGLAFSGLGLSSTAKIQWNSGDIDITHSSNKLDFNGGAYDFNGNVDIQGDLTVSGSFPSDFAITDEQPLLSDYWAKTLELNHLPSFEGKDRGNVMTYINGLEESNERLLRYIVDLEKRISDLEQGK